MSDYELFDSHCHLSAFEAVLQPDILAAARAQNVHHTLAPAASLADLERVAAIQAPGVIKAFGVHPWHLDEDLRALDAVAHHLRAHPSALVGEIGLDFFNRPTPEQITQQESWFMAQVDLAQQLQRPIVLHQRNSLWRCQKLLRQHRFEYRGFAHAFSGSLNEAQEWAKAGFMIGIGLELLNPDGRRIREIAINMPLETLVLETDAPFMAHAAQKYAGAPNQPTLVATLAAKLAQLRQTDVSTIAQATCANAHKIIRKQ